MAPLDHLLDALLLEGPQAHDAWRQWRAAADLDALDPASFVLLPTLAAQFSQWLVEDPSQRILLGICRQAWSRNQLQMRGLNEAVAVLRQANSERVIAAGPAVWAAVYWPEKAIRPIGAIDLIVEPSVIRHSLEAFSKAGWTAPEQSKWPEMNAFRFGAPTLLRSASGSIVRLQTRALPNPDLTMSSQGRPPLVPLKIGQGELWTVSAEHAFVAALTGYYEDGVDWRADALMIFRSAPMDWQLVAALVGHRSLARTRIDELRGLWRARIPYETTCEGWLQGCERLVAGALRTYRRRRRN